MISGLVRSVQGSAFLLWVGLSFVYPQQAPGQVFFGAPANQQDFVRMFAFNGRSDVDVRKQLNLLSKARISLVASVAKLEDGQQGKLQLAADADLKRFFRQVDQVREQLQEQNLDQNDFNEAWQTVRPLQVKMQQGIFDGQSLFQKVCQSILTEPQEKAYQEELRRQRQRRWNIITRVNLAEIERKSMPLTMSQRDQLLTLLNGIDLPTNLNKQMDGYAGYLRLVVAEGKDEDERIKKILTPAQMKVIDQYRQRYQGWAQMVAP